MPQTCARRFQQHVPSLVRLVKISHVVVIVRIALGKLAVGKDRRITGERIGGIQQQDGPIGIAMFVGQAPLRVLEMRALQQRAFQCPAAVGATPGIFRSGNKNAAQVWVREAPSNGFETGNLRPRCGRLVVRRRFQAAQVEHGADGTARNSADREYAVLKAADRFISSQTTEHSAGPCGGLNAAARRSHDDQRLRRVVKREFGRRERVVILKFYGGENMIGAAEMCHAEQERGSTSKTGKRNRSARNVRAASKPFQKIKTNNKKFSTVLGGPPFVHS